MERLRYRLLRTLVGKGDRPENFREALRGVCVDSAGLLYAVGDSQVKVYKEDGSLQRRWATAKPGLCVTVDETGAVHVGEEGQVEKFDAEGRRIGTLRDGTRLGVITEVAVLKESVLLGDATHRGIHRYDLDGTYRNAIGKDNRTRGLMIPNGAVDFAVDPEGILHAANPGKHRVERYTPSGELLGHFGKFTGTQPEGFSGCCNPTNVALTRDGRVVVTVKAPPRAKIYDRTGKLLALLGVDAFDPAAKNMDVAVDGKARIYVADTVRLQVCVFATADYGDTDGTDSHRDKEER